MMGECESRAGVGINVSLRLGGHECESRSGVDMSVSLTRSLCVSLSSVWKLRRAMCRVSRSISPSPPRAGDREQPGDPLCGSPSVPLSPPMSVKKYRHVL